MTEVFMEAHSVELSQLPWVIFFIPPVKRAQSQEGLTLVPTLPPNCVLLDFVTFAFIWKSFHLKGQLSQCTVIIKLMSMFGLDSFIEFYDTFFSFVHFFYLDGLDFCSNGYLDIIIHFGLSPLLFLLLCFAFPLWALVKLDINLFLLLLFFFFSLYFLSCDMK